MELRNEKYTVLLKTEVAPPLSQYDIIHNTEEVNTDDFYVARTFQVHRADGHLRNIALLDLCCSSNEPFAVLNDHILTVILFRAIVRIDLNTGLIIQHKECNSTGGLFEIHHMDDGYLIWGEGDIFRYDDSLNRIWHFVGRDILVSLHCNQHFWMERDEIHCRDFLGWHYILDLDGNVLCNFREFDDCEAR